MGKATLCPVLVTHTKGSSSKIKGMEKGQSTRQKVEKFMKEIGSMTRGTGKEYLQSRTETFCKETSRMVNLKERSESWSRWKSKITKN